MKLSENFTLEEMIASSRARVLRIDNIPNEIQIENLKRLCESVLQPIRERIGSPIKVTSGFRCPVLNKSVGGSPTSQHITGEAADIVANDNKKLWQLIMGMIKAREIEVGQLINERNLSWIHISLPTSRLQNQILALY